MESVVKCNLFRQTCPLYYFSMFYSKTLSKILRAWPGKRYLAEYRFLPIFFVGGAAIEFLMIKWHPNGVNFYKTYKRNKVNEIIEKRERAALLKEHNIEIVVHPLKAL